MPVTGDYLVVRKDGHFYRSVPTKRRELPFPAVRSRRNLEMPPNKTKSPRNMKVEESKTARLVHNRRAEPAFPRTKRDQ
jgi:hypothetical protein